MKRRRLITSIFGVGALTLVLAGCGVGMNGAPQPVSVSGAMTRGSVIVGGVRFEDASAAVSADETGQGLGYLQDGMTIKLRGTVNPDGVSGTATHVEVEDVLTGPVSAVDPTTSSFEVLGFTVSVTGGTHFESGYSFAAVTVGDVVEVYGFAAGDHIRATRVEDEDSVSYFEVRGRVSEKTGTTFRVGSSTLDFSYDGSTEIEYGSDFLVGDLIEAEIATDGSLQALRVELEDAEDEAYYADGEVEIEGFISGFTAHPGTFFVGDTEVRTGDATEFEGGDPINLADGVLVEVEGEYSGSVLFAEEIYFEDNVVIVANAPANANADLLGITVTTSVGTRFDGLPGGLSDILEGDGLRVEGFTQPDGSVSAVSVTKLGGPVDSGENELQGPVASVVDDTVVILGITVDFSGATEFSDDDDVIDAAGFAAQLVEGIIVEAEGSFAAGVLSATEIELD